MPHQHSTDPELIEKIKAEGSEYFVCRELHKITAVARDVGISRDELSMALISHALNLCRPDPIERKSLANFLRRQARLLEPTENERTNW